MLTAEREMEIREWMCRELNTYDQHVSEAIMIKELLHEVERLREESDFFNAEAMALHKKLSEVDGRSR